MSSRSHCGWCSVDVTASSSAGHGQAAHLFQRLRSGQHVPAALGSNLVKQRADGWFTQRCDPPRPGSSLLLKGFAFLARQLIEHPHGEVLIPMLAKLTLGVVEELARIGFAHG